MFIGKRINKLRANLNMSQKELANRVGISRQAVSQIENGERKISADELLKFSEIFRVSADALLNKEKEPEVILEKAGEKNKEEEKIRISVPHKNVKKFKEALLYILGKVGANVNVGETVIYKLLYFADFNYYEKYEEHLIGAKYQKNHFGPTPVEFGEITKEMIKDGELKDNENDYFGCPQKRYLPQREADLAVFNGNELRVIDDVLHLAHMNASQISDYSHNDIPWLTTDDGDIIDYESVFYRTPQYSVRDEEEAL